MKRKSSAASTQPYVVIVGGGQGGIALGARLRQLGVPTIIVDRNPRPGDAVAQALQVADLARSGLVRPSSVHRLSAKLAGLLTEGQIADWLEMYTRVMELNYWDSTECKRASYNETARSGRLLSSATESR